MYLFEALCKNTQFAIALFVCPFNRNDFAGNDPTSFSQARS
jgi:hypothetical protein